MASIAFKHVGKTWSDGKQVLHDINLEVADGEFLVLVGPSGCGKSTLLRMLAGLESITAGELWIDDLLANNIPPAQRGLAMVFQSYALYPHMNVFDNMAFSLKMAGKAKAQIKQDVERAAEILQITSLLQRKPGQLSGGQRQRVAIGRAIVRQPKVFLFDEPLSNLDASLRLQMRLELANLHQQLHSTMVYVTHDQVEAMTLGQRIVVLNAGKIEQVGTPQQLYEQPANLFVAGFLGTPKMNFLPTLGLNMLLPNLPANAVTLGIRAEHILLQQQVPAITTDAITLPAAVAHVEYLGDAAQVYLRLPEASQLLCARQAANAASLAAGTEMFITLPLAHLHWFDAAGNNICRVGNELPTLQH